jgi:cold shock CspA family protein
VVRLFRGEEYGFLKTLEGREIYVHRHSVVGDDWERLEIGTEVRFTEAEGELGPPGQHGPDRGQAPAAGLFLPGAQRRGAGRSIPEPGARIAMRTTARRTSAVPSRARGRRGAGATAGGARRGTSRDRSRT